MARNTIPRALIIEREKKVWHMRMRGATYERIAQELGITFSGVHKILGRLHKRYQQKNMDSIEKHKMEQIGELSNIADEAYRAWTISSTEDNPAGDAKFLTVYLKAKEDVRKMLGVDAASKREVTGKDGGAIKIESHFQDTESELNKIYSSIKDDK